MQTPKQLRAEATRCIQAAKAAPDPSVRQRLCARAFQLAQEAEALVRATEDPPEPAINGHDPAGLARQLGKLRRNTDQFRRFLPTEVDRPILRDLAKLFASAGRGLAQFVTIRARR